MMINAVPKTVLYIEDDALSRLLVERTLTQAGYRVLVAETALRGIDIARHEQPDLILTDINLPDMTGRELTTALRGESRFAHVPIVAVTAQARNEQRQMSLAAGVNGYLTKPINVRALPGQIEHYLGGAQDAQDDKTRAQAQQQYAQEIVSRLEERIRGLEMLNDELRRLDRMKESFIQITAHELRTPLTAVYGYSRMIETLPAFQAITDGDEMARTVVGGLTDSIRRMQAIINEIVVMSRIVTNNVDLTVGSVNLGATAQKVIGVYQTALDERHLMLRWQPDEWPAAMRADGELLALLLSNLLSNAIKYTPDDGTISLSARYDEQRVRFSVRDTGIGVAAQDREAIFEQFHTAGDTLLHSTSKTAFNGGGIGLGLAVCKGIVQAHGGRIWVESSGRDPISLPGSEFIVVLPLVQATRKGANA